MGGRSVAAIGSALSVRAAAGSWQALLHCAPTCAVTAALRLADEVEGRSATDVVQAACAAGGGRAACQQLPASLCVVPAQRRAALGPVWAVVRRRPLLQSMRAIRKGPANRQTSTGASEQVRGWRGRPLHALHCITLHSVSGVLYKLLIALRCHSSSRQSSRELRAAHLLLGSSG